MSHDIKKQILNKLDDRIGILQEHRRDEIKDDNQYGELNQAISKVLNVALCKELEDLKAFVKDL